MAGKQKPSRFEENRLFVLNDPLSPRLSPALAVEMGLNESLLFLQLEFLIVVEGIWIDDRKWVRKSLTDWTAIFSFISTQTINRAIEQLKKEQYIYVENFDKGNHKAPRWFAINTEGASKLKSITMLNALSQNETEPPQEDDDLSQNETESAKEDKPPLSQNEMDSLQQDKALSQNERDLSQNEIDSPQQAKAAPSQNEIEPSQNEIELSQNVMESSQNETAMNKEKERGRERESKERHTQEKKGVLNLSKFPRPQIRQWVEWRLARGGPKCDSYVVSLARVKDGEADEEIERDWPQVQAWLDDQGSRKGAGNDIVLPGEDVPELLAEFLQAIRAKINHQSFATWFAPIEAMSRADGTIYLRTPSIVIRDRRLPKAEYRDWLITNYTDIIEETLAEIGLGEYRFQFVIKQI